ncbi:recombinase family protein [Diaminobutyricibacter tongyongensis]|uniref:Recombinase family protein n=1 Tax=Leifsonia tongyongensis TaxID=1268043 RepID=A0A6L9Y252_9MICO|nr:recombinase family protein [Diaminobutyricibacter tongyongensis]NEN07762.1 recombinase family protein [Diaminobutyricibacter tongyongensis]
MQAAIYCRISSDPEGFALGVQRQEDMCRALAARLGLVVAAVFVDNDVSASSRSNKARPEYAAMLRRARLNEFGVIVAYSNSRLTRRPQEFNELIDAAVKHQVRISTVASGEFDLNTADGRAVARTIAAWDAAESDRLSERVKAAADQRAASGRFHGGPAPLGFRVRNKTLVVAPAEAKLIRSAIARIIAGDSTYAIVKDWNAKRVPTRRVKRWSAMVLRQAVCNPALIGLNKAGVPSWDPIVDLATFTTVVDVLSERGRHDVPYERSSLGGGLTHCGRCGARLIRSTSGANSVMICVAGRRAHPRDGSDPRADPSGLSCGKTMMKADRLEAYAFDAVLNMLPVHAMSARSRRSETLNEIERLDLIVLGLEAEQPHWEVKGTGRATAETRHLLVERREAKRALTDVLDRVQFNEIFAGGVDWRSWSIPRRAHFLRFTVDRIEIDPLPVGRKSPPHTPHMTRETWERLESDFWDEMAPQRIRIMY